MSLASWIEEFYPVCADECPRDQALEHSILKWTGLLPKNLEKHGVVKQRLYIQDPSGDWLAINGSSCALCEYYCHTRVSCNEEENPCPIVVVTGKDCDSQYGKFVLDGQVTPMLDLLCQVKEALDAPQV